MKAIKIFSLLILSVHFSSAQFMLWKVDRSGGAVTDSLYYKAGVSDSIYKKSGNSYIAKKKARTIYYPVWDMISGKPVAVTSLTDSFTAIRGSIPSVSGKLNITDTAGMLSGYSRGTHTHAYATITGTPTIPTNTNQLTNGAGFLSSYAGQTNYTAYGTGTAYTLTATSAAVTFGTTSPAITITSAGTYMIYYDVQTNYNGATFAASRTISYKLRRTNNTPADLTSSTISFATQIITTLTFSPTQKQRMIIYTASAGDIIQLWGSVSVLPTAGSAQVNDASIIAVKQY